jgi:hypothetical protein
MSRVVRLLLFAAVVISSAAAEAAPGDDPAALVGSLPEQKSVVDRAAALVQAAQNTPDASARSAKTAEPRRMLEQFLRDRPTDDDVARAEMWMGVLLTLEGKDAAAVAVQVDDPAARTAQLEAARKTLRDADRYFATSVDRNASRLATMPSFVPPDTPDHARREALKGTVIQVRMYHAGVVEELAATYPADGDEARDLYKAAADRYESIYRDYRVLYAGLVARLKQGQCYRNLGDTKRALGLYNDVLSQPDELSPLRRLRVTAMYLSLECWATPQEKLYELTFSQGEEYLAGVRPEEKSWPEWQAVRYHTARGYLLAAETLPADRANERPELLEHALRWANAARETDGPYRTAAQTLTVEARRAAGETAP